MVSGCTSSVARRASPTRSTGARDSCKRPAPRLETSSRAVIRLLSRCDCDTINSSDCCMGVGAVSSRRARRNASWALPSSVVNGVRSSCAAIDRKLSRTPTAASAARRAARSRSNKSARSNSSRLRSVMSRCVPQIRTTTPCSIMPIRLFKTYTCSPSQSTSTLS